MKVISFLLSQIYLINFCFGSYSWSQPYYDSHLSNKFPGSAPNQNKTFLSSYISSIMITQTASVGTYFNSIPVFDSKGTAFCFSDLSIFYPSIQAVNILERQQLWEKDVVSSLSLKTSYSYFSRTFVFDEINDSLYIGIQYHSPSYVNIFLRFFLKKSPKNKRKCFIP